MSDSRQAQNRARGRPVSKYGPKKAPKKFKNKIVDYEYRLKVVKLYEAHGMPTVLDTLYSTLGPTQRESTRKKIYGWIAAKDHIVAKARSPRTSHQKCVCAIGTGTTLPDNIEEQLAQWIHGMRRDGVPVTYGMLRIMAVEMATDAGIKDHEFKASTRWVQGFRRRHRFAWRVKTRIGQVSNDDGDEKLKEFSKKIREMMQQEGIELSTMLIKRQLTTNSIRQQVLSSRASGVNFKLEPPKRSTIVAWISTAWDSLPSLVIVNGIKKCKLVYGEEEDHETMDGYVDDTLLSTLMESLDIEHVISSTDDIENAVDDEEDQDGELRVFYL
ncbi:hypothetical protein LEN26_008344 [Aphanomyces euteiches]|nr:hypothetical protein LEN26_008344 [Aphanomyces euteiches]